LPKKAWEKMTEEEKEETERKKEEGGMKGMQFVGNTEKAKESRKAVNEEEDGEYEEGKEEEAKAKAKQGKGEAGKHGVSKDDEGKDDEDGDVVNDGEEDDGEADCQNDGQVDDGDAGEEEAEEEDENDENADHNDDTKAKVGQKRSRGQQNGSKKSQKSNSGKANSKPKGTVGSKHMDATEPAPRGAADRLPKKGQQVHWRAMPGYVDGEVVEVLTSGKKVDGRDQKASKDDPKVVLKSNKSGKICVHKPESCFYK